MIGIIGAMEAETKALIEAIREPRTECISGITYVSGRLCGREVVVATCGIGKVYAAICAQTMILRYAPTLIVNTGVAGTLCEELGIGDVAIATELVQHDMDTSPVGDPVGLVSGINKIYFEADADSVDKFSEILATQGINAVKGRIASGDQFVARAEVKDRIRSQFGAIACEMEGAAIAHVAAVNRVPVAVLRTISDSADGDAVSDYPAFVGEAAARSVSVLLAFLSA